MISIIVALNENVCVRIFTDDARRQTANDKGSVGGGGDGAAGWTALTSSLESDRPLPSAEGRRARSSASVEGTAEPKWSRKNWKGIQKKKQPPPPRARATSNEARRRSRHGIIVTLCPAANPLRRSCPFVNPHTLAIVRRQL